MSSRSPLKHELTDLAKGSAGAFLFGLPLLYTMEVWFQGKSHSNYFFMTFLFLMIGANMLFAYIAGFHHHRSQNIRDAFLEGVSSCGLGILLATIILWLIGAIHSFQTEDLGIILFEGLLMSLGVSFANYKFHSVFDQRAKIHLPMGLLLKAPREGAFIREIAAAVTGAIIFSMNMAPTEEIILIATRISNFKLILLLILEIWVTHLILNVAGNKPLFLSHRPFYKRPWIHSIMTQAIGLAVALFLYMIGGFGQPIPGSSILLSIIVVLGLPATIGAAAGRIIL